MPNLTHSVTAITNVQITGNPMKNAIQTATALPFFGEIIVPDYGDGTWAQREYEKDHKGWRSLGNLNNDSNR